MVEDTSYMTNKIKYSELRLIKNVERKCLGEEFNS